MPICLPRIGVGMEWSPFVRSFVSIGGASRPKREAENIHTDWLALLEGQNVMKNVMNACRSSIHCVTRVLGCEIEQHVSRLCIHSWT